MTATDGVSLTTAIDGAGSLVSLSNDTLPPPTAGVFLSGGVRAFIR